MDGGTQSSATLFRRLRQAGDLLRRLGKRAKEDRVGFQSAAVSFYLLVALVPALTAIAGIYGIVADPTDVVSQLAQLKGLIPQDAYDLLESELTHLTSKRGAPGFGLTFGLLLALWGSSKGVTALMTALNDAYRVEETRGWIHRKFLGLAVACGGVLLMAALVGLLGALPAILRMTSPGALSETLFAVLRWPVIFAVVILALSLAYRLVPCHPAPRWKWVTPGGLLAAVVWIPASFGLTVYCAEIGSRNVSYGSLTAVIFLMLWFYVTVFVVLIGAGLNALAGGVRAEKKAV